VADDTFGRYELRGVIGQGAQGKVFRAWDPVLQREVAIKVLAPDLAEEPNFRERFRREALTTARLTDPHVIPVFDSGDLRGQLYLVMAVIAGVDLAKLLHRDGPISPDRTVRVIEALASALDTAHAAGLVHRDVKPSNVLISDRGHIYLIDFGIAHDTAATQITQTGTRIGTLAYMAPERFEAGKIDARGDVYSLACVLYECLTGEVPFPATTVEQLIAAHLIQDPPRPSERRLGVPTGLDQVVACGMAKNPEQRYRTATELATAARDALSSAAAPVDQPPSTPTEPSSQTRAPTVQPTVPTAPVEPTPGPHSSMTPPPATSPPPATQAADTVLAAPTPPATLSFDLVQPAQDIGQRPARLAPTGPALPPEPVRPTHPRIRRLGRTKLMLAAVALVVTVAAVVVIVVESQSHPHGGIATSTATTTSTATPTTTPTVDPESRLLTLVPADAMCSREDFTLETGSLAETLCFGDSPPWGPGRLWYALFPDQATLDREFNMYSSPRPESTSERLVPCPGMGQSPQYWHRAATPQQNEGKIACMADPGNPSHGVVVWTIDSELLFGNGQVSGGGSTLAQVFQWWAAHYQ
jgi:serine/threonine protein kinase